MMMVCSLEPVQIIFQIPLMFYISIYYKDAFFTPYLGHGEAVRVLDAELGTLEMEKFRDTKSTTRRRGVSRRESSSHGMSYELFSGVHALD